MFRNRPQAFPALAQSNAAAKRRAEEIGGVLLTQDVEPFLPGDINAGAEFAEQIQSAIRRADLVVADLTVSNPNVLFEVGMALGLNKPVVLVTSGPIERAPADMRAYEFIS